MSWGLGDLLLIWSNRPGVNIVNIALGSLALLVFSGILTAIDVLTLHSFVFEKPAVCFPISPQFNLSNSFLRLPSAHISACGTFSMVYPLSLSTKHCWHRSFAKDSGACFRACRPDANQASWDSFSLCMYCECVLDYTENWTGVVLGDVQLSFQEACLLQVWFSSSPSKNAKSHKILVNLIWKHKSPISMQTFLQTSFKKLIPRLGINRIGRATLLCPRP